MIDVLPIESGRLVAFRVHGKLTHEDYRDAILPQLAKVFQEHDKVRCLCVLGEGYAGITAGALWDELKLDLKYRKGFERAAIVTDNALVRAVTHLSRPFFAGEVRLYKTGEQAQAEQWLREGLAD
jgi:SpoIIAA-like